MTVLEGKVDTCPEIVEVLECHGYTATLASDGSGILLAVQGKDAYMAQMQIIDGELLINCQIGELGDFGEDTAQTTLAFLWANSQINPYAVTVLQPENLDDPTVEQLNVVLTDKVPVADLDASEVVAAVESLYEAVQIIEETYSELN